jgi:multidrug efflux pump subunit AcrA (membrane-fusion protein)
LSVQTGDSAPITASSTAAEPDDSVAQQLLLQHTLEQQQAQVATLRQQIDASQLRAPYNGILASIQARVGDTVEARQQVAIMASADAPIVTVEIPESPSGKASVGDQVQVELNRSQLTGQIAALKDSSTPSSRLAEIAVAWSGERPALGSTVQVGVLLQRKDGALVVPKKAVRSIGTQKTVQILDGKIAKTVDVTVGISSTDETEIVTGLAEDQTVILP